MAEALPDEFSKEREALIRQLSELLASQQAILLPMLVELRAALEAGNLTATSVDGAVRSIDALVGRLKAPPGAGAARQNVNTIPSAGPEKAMSYSKRLEPLPLS